MKFKTIIYDEDGTELATQEMPANSEVELEIREKIIILTVKVE